jgi:hypothetical protein
MGAGVIQWPPSSLWNLTSFYKQWTGVTYPCFGKTPMAEWGRQGTVREGCCGPAQGWKLDKAERSGIEETVW